MIATSIAPLRKYDKDGKVYTRLPETEATLGKLLALSFEDLVARCVIEECENPDYVPSECLLHLLRQYRSKPFEQCSEVLFRTLLARLMRALPPAAYCNGEKEDLTQGNVRDEGRGRFLEMLARDRQDEYVEELDYYEVRFQSALACLRADVQRYIYRRQNPLDSIEIDPETGELSKEVLKAAIDFDPFASNEIDNSDYRTQLDTAIDTLPEIQKAIIQMLRNGIPIESKEPGKINISQVLNKTPKTIATHRDAAYAKLRAKLKIGEAV
jgi:hypothetical protein